MFFRICSYAVFCLTFVLLSQVVIAQETPTTVIPVQPDADSLLEVLKTVKELRTSGMHDLVTLQLSKGVYQFSETLTLNAETVGDGLTLLGPKEGEAIFSGAMRLVGKPDTSGNWRYELPGDWKADGTPRVLVIDGELRSAARFPDQGYLRIDRALEDRRSGFIAQADDLSDNLDLSHSLCDLILLHDWSSSRMPVKSYEPGTREIRSVGPIGCEAKHYSIDHFEKQPRYWLEGHQDFANLPGEWYVDQASGEIVVKADPSAPAAPELMLPRLETILKASGSGESTLQDLELKGITFTGTHFAMPAGGLAGAQATMHEPRDANGERTTSNRPMLSAGVLIENAIRCRISNCRFQAMGNTGLWLGSRTSHCKIFRCQVNNVGGNGFNLGEDNSRKIDGVTWYQAAPLQIPTLNTIDQCSISNCGKVLPGAVAIWAPLNKGLKIVNNQISDCPYTGISLGWIWNATKSPAGHNEIDNNRIEFVLQVLSDGGGIYTLGNQPESKITRNSISDIPLNAGRAESNGIFLDEGSTGFRINENTFRRIDRSPIRFHKAGENTVSGNHWELAADETPPVRFNNTPEQNITITDNSVLDPQPGIYLIGNSLTWDTIPSRLEGNVHWHVDCGKNLTYIKQHPQSPCVSSSRIWPVALPSTKYDFVCFQPHYGTTLEDDVAHISAWMEQQPQAVIIVHTGWGKSAQLEDEYADTDPAGELTHSAAYFDELHQRLSARYPNRDIRSTQAIQLIQKIKQDIAQQQAPFDKIEDIYRDAIHMKLETGRYLMHNAMRHALGQPRTTDGFPEIPVNVRSYLDGLLEGLK